MSYIPGFSRRITLDLSGVSSIAGSNQMDPPTAQEWGRTSILVGGEPPDPSVSGDVTAVAASNVGLLGGVGSSSTTAIG